MTISDDATDRLAEAMTAGVRPDEYQFREFWADVAIQAIAADPSLLDGVVPTMTRSAFLESWHNQDAEDEVTEYLESLAPILILPTPEAAPLPTVEPLERYMSNLHAYFTVITQDAADGRYPSRTSKAMYEHVEQMIAGLHAAASKGAANG